MFQWTNYDSPEEASAAAITTYFPNWSPNVNEETLKNPWWFKVSS